MNILIDELPTSLDVDGKSYPIRTSFRDCVRVMTAFEDTTLAPQEKQLIMLLNLFEKVPSNAQEAMKQATWFLDGGKDNDTVSTGSGRRLYSWSKDAGYIFSAFKQTHNIDLSTTDLHWWTFLALFMDLGQDTFFCQLTSLRKRYAEGKLSKEERQMVNDMRDVFDLPDVDTMTLEEKEAERAYQRLVEGR